MRCLGLLFSISVMFGCSPAEGPRYARDAFVSALEDAYVNPDLGAVDDAGWSNVDSSTFLGDTFVPGRSDVGLGLGRTPVSDVRWQARSCVAIIEHCELSNYVVKVAGDFTCNPNDECWAQGAHEMTRTDEACGSGGQVIFRATIEPNERLTPGTTLGYKLLKTAPGSVERWALDDDAAYRVLQDGCLNSGLRLPSCRERPSIEILSAERPSWDGIRIRARLSVAVDGPMIGRVDVAVDGRPTEAYALDEQGHLEIDLGGLTPGKHRVQFIVTDTAGTPSEPVIIPFWAEEVPFDWRDGPMYLLFIDRFANGDVTNDRPLGSVTASLDWFGGDLQGAANAVRSGYLEGLGVRTIWLSPVNMQVEGAMEARESVDLVAPYHGYWPTRARVVEPRFGGEEALRRFITLAHSRGIRVLLDLINNQVHEEHEYVSQHPDWFRRGCVCGVGDGCGWSERPFDCLFAPYLPDIDWTHPDAEEQFIQDALYWIEEFDVDGFRVDAVKHVEPMAVFNLRAALSRRFGPEGERVIMLGETAVSATDRYDGLCGVRYSDGYAWIEGYTGERGLDGQFDFPTFHRLEGLLRGESSLREIEAAISDAEARYEPASLHVQFLGSHDTARVASRAARDPLIGCRLAQECDGRLPEVSRDEATYRRLRRAWIVLYTMRTIPLLYYGDEIALPGARDPDNRRPFPWGREMGADLSDELTDAQREHLGFMRQIGHIRSRHPALQSGERITLMVDDDVLLYLRRTANASVLVVINRGVDREIALQGLEYQTLEVLLGDLFLVSTEDGVRITVPAESVGLIGTATP